LTEGQYALPDHVVHLFAARGVVERDVAGPAYSCPPGARQVPRLTECREFEVGAAAKPDAVEASVRTGLFGKVHGHARYRTAAPFRAVLSPSRDRTNRHDNPRLGPCDRLQALPEHCLVERVASLEFNDLVPQESSRRVKEFDRPVRRFHYMTCEGGPVVAFPHPCRIPLISNARMISPHPGGTSKS